MGLNGETLNILRDVLKSHCLYKKFIFIKMINLQTSMYEKN